MGNEQQSQSNNNQNSFADKISDILFRWRKMILISTVSIIAIAIGWGIFVAVSSSNRQKIAETIYQMRKAFEQWQEANPESLLTAAKNLEDSNEKLDIDEETKRKKEETEKTLETLLEQNIAASQKNIQAWAYWIKFRKALYLKGKTNFQTMQNGKAALEKLLTLQDPTFHSIAKLHLAGLFYSEGQTAKAISLWQELADINGPEPEQIIASIYLGNYFARNDKKDEAILYWQQVQSLGQELQQVSGFLGGENLITGNFRNTFKQWKTMAENQLLFLQSEKIQIAADSYDETIQPEQ